MKVMNDIMFQYFDEHKKTSLHSNTRQSGVVLRHVSCFSYIYLCSCFMKLNSLGTWLTMTISLAHQHNRQGEEMKQQVFTGNTNLLYGENAGE